MFERLNEKQKSQVLNILNSMTTDEKIGQLVNEHADFLMKKVENPIEFLRKYPVGSIFTGSEIIDSFANGVAETSKIQDIIKKADLKIPMLFSGDFENGIGGQIDGFTVMPRTMGLSATFSEQDSYDFGKVIGTEGTALDIRWCFGPVVDLNTNPGNPVTNIRSAGDTPDHALKILKNIVKGMQDNGCAACIKHFPGDGTDSRNQHYVTSLNTLSKNEWDKQHGRVFKELIDAGAMSIMAGHIGFPAYEEIDSDKQQYRPATCSRKLMTDLLRHELGFDGIILTDALCMVGYLSWGDYETRILDTFNGGADVFLWPDTKKFFALMHAALRDGRVSEERLNESVKRILSFKTLLNLTADASANKTVSVKELLEENGKTAERIAQNCITLLRNKDKVLPLQLEKGAKILVITSPDKPGPAKYLPHFSQELAGRGFNVTTVKSSEYSTVAGQIENFDSVMYLSDANPQYGEYSGFDTVFWDFMTDAYKMKKLIMISFGTPYFLYDVPSAPTYINAYHDNSHCIHATIQAMFGEIPFKGKSPVSMKYCFNYGDGLSC